MKPIIVCIMGKAGSGKTTTAKQLVDTYGFKEPFGVTTRPLRDSDKNVTSISVEEFKILFSYGRIELITKHGNNWYGKLPIARCENSESNARDFGESYIYVVNREGYNDLISSYGKENVLGIYLCPFEIDRELRLKEREGSTFLLNSERKESDKDLDNLYTIEDVVCISKGSVEEVRKEVWKAYKRKFSPNPKY